LQRPRCEQEANGNRGNPDEDGHGRIRCHERDHHDPENCCFDHFLNALAKKNIKKITAKK
jgi:hypothetical protein